MLWCYLGKNIASQLQQLLGSLFTAPSGNQLCVVLLMPFAVQKRGGNAEPCLKLMRVNPKLKGEAFSLSTI